MTYSGGDTLTDRLATITTDTGAFAPGHHDFSRYDSPQLCLTAAENTRQGLRRSLAVHALPHWTADDTVGNAGAARVARACAAHLTFQPTPADNVPWFRLAVDEQNDSLALTVLKTLSQRLALDDWSFVMNWLLERGRPAAAEAVTAQIDAQGPNARTLQFKLRFCLVTHSCGYDRALYVVTEADTLGFRPGLERLLPLGDEVPADPQSLLLVIGAYQQLLSWTVQLAPDSLPAMAARARHALERFNNVRGRTHSEEALFANFRRAVATSTAAVAQSLAPGWFTYQQRMGGPAKAPRLTANYWFPAPGSPINDTIRPASGKVNLICSGATTHDDAWKDLGFSSAEQAHYLKKVTAMYGAAGLNVTLVRPAQGYEIFRYDGAGLGNDWHWFASPADEAHMWQWYAQIYEGLPVTVAVQARHDTWLQDGRRYTEGPIQFNTLFQNFHQKPAPQAPADTIVDDARFVHPGRVYSNGPVFSSSYSWRPGEASGFCTVIDRDGTIVWASEKEPSLGALDVVLYRLFHGSAGK